ncbi:diadenylate cyclase [Caldanaerobius fijiensis DSM 17918]|uniref:Diadenylate cyclase n=1 Tax=Caldanaerobius fijiensis DSM 17918 TaxID=1121256 RepID=A0A1M4VNR3_9THEO|nr:diadenylate cyclase CdaA [Caldanaerobius fijiensis]SHE70741.1 diadenylate cyclase [Caldanaerobius fijiensis DSM 17918]
MNELVNLVKAMRFSDFVDIAIIAYILYKIFQVIRRTRAEQLLKGLFILLVATKLSEILQLRTINWILRNAMTVGVIALLIVFQPELRNALESLGRNKVFTKFIFSTEQESSAEVVEEIVKAVKYLSKSSIGALIVIERETGLNDIINTGTKMESLISGELLINIFIPNTPLHDGAVLIRGNKIMAAGCFLPLSQNNDISKDLGTRHRAGIGITEISDAICVIVSEETGTISIAQNGKISRYLDIKTLKEVLLSQLKRKQIDFKASNWFKWVNKHE